MPIGHDLSGFCPTTLFLNTLIQKKKMWVVTGVSSFFINAHLSLWYVCFVSHISTTARGNHTPVRPLYSFATICLYARPIQMHLDTPLEIKDVKTPWKNIYKYKVLFLWSPIIQEQWLTILALLVKISSFLNREVWAKSTWKNIQLEHLWGASKT